MSRTAEIENALKVREAAASLVRNPGWKDWLLPWLQDQQAARWQVLRSGNAEEVKRAQIELDLLDQIVEKPEQDLEVTDSMLKPKP